MLHVLVMAPSACCNERGVALNTANSLCASAIAVFSSATSSSKDALIFCASANALGACFLRTASTCASLSKDALWRLAILKTSDNTALRKGALPHFLQFKRLADDMPQPCTPQVAKQKPDNRTNLGISVEFWERDHTPHNYVHNRRRYYWVVAHNLHDGGVWHHCQARVVRPEPWRCAGVLPMTYGRLDEGGAGEHKWVGFK